MTLQVKSVTLDEITLNFSKRKKSSQIYRGKIALLEKATDFVNTFYKNY